MSWILEKHEKRFMRALELFPGGLAWSIILFPAIGGIFFPEIVAYFILFFLAFWFIRSFKSAFLSIRGFFILSEWNKTDFKKRYLEEKTSKSLDFEDIKHVIIIPAYNESEKVISVALDSIKNQEQINKRNLFVVLAMEERAKGAKERAENLIKKYKNNFGFIRATYHPDGIPGEVRGKASNEAWAAKIARGWLKEENIDIKKTTVTSCDVDTNFHKYYFAALSYLFATDNKRYLKFWQSPIFWYNNLHRVPFPVKMLGVIGTAIHLSDLQESLIFNQSSYSLSFKLLEDVGYWHTNIIPEDWHLFLQTFFEKKGKVSVTPIFLPTHVDAPESATWIGTLKNRYKQCQRHAWGASDIPYAIAESIRHKEIPLTSRVARLYKLIETHVIWSTNWFLLTVGATLPLIINPAFSRTSLGYNLPRAAEGFLTICLIALAVMVFIDMMLRPKHAKPVSVFTAIKEVVQWVTLPVVTLPLSVLPGLHAQTLLMLGKRLEYKVTEKV